MWEAAGARVSASVNRCSAAAVLGDDPAATGAVALGVARAHAFGRRVYLLDLLGDGQGITTLDVGDDPPGVSDMVHYGISLPRAGRARRDAPNLVVIPGGAESPLTDEVLTHRWWSVVVEQVRRANALLLVAAPAMVPAIGAMVRHLDGMLLVGEAAAPTARTPVLAEVRTAAALRGTPSAPKRTVIEPAPSRRGWRIAALGAVAVAAALFATTPRWRPLVERAVPALAGSRAPAAQSAADASLPPLPSAEAAPTGPINEASFSVELLFTNSPQDALTYVTAPTDTLPAATFSTLTIETDSTPWYRLLTGAFPDSVSADAFLAQLRSRGRLGTGAGSVARTPFALLLDSASSDALAMLRVSAYRGRGIPAYALRDTTPVWRVYAGAFATEADASLLKQQLDSLNIQSALVMRAGSTP